MTIKVGVLSEYSEFLDLQNEWQQLIENKNGATFFMSHKWLSLWWKHYSCGDDTLMIFTVSSNHQLIAILPLYQKNNTLRFIGTNDVEFDEVCTEYCDIICANDYEDIVLTALYPKLESYFNLGIELKLTDYLEGSLMHGLQKSLSNSTWAYTLLVGYSYSCKLPIDFNSFLSSLPSSFEKQLRRHSNKFKLNGILKKAQSQKQLEEYLSILKELHTARWRLKNNEGAFTSARFINFHLDYCRYLLNQKQLQLWLLEIEGEVIAATYCIDFGKNRYFYQSGTNTLFKPNISPGNLLHLQLIEDSIQKNFTNYDFMMGSVESSYKEKFTNRKVNMYNTHIIKKSITNFPTRVLWWLKTLRLKYLNG